MTLLGDLSDSNFLPQATYLPVLEITLLDLELWISNSISIQVVGDLTVIF